MRSARAHRKVLSAVTAALVVIAGSFVFPGSALAAPGPATSAPLLVQNAASGTPGASSPAAQLVPGTQWIDTTDRAAVLAAYHAEFDRSEPPMGFTGDVASCTPGTTSAAFRASIMQRVNWYRRMAGTGVDVTEDATKSVSAQKAALIMSATGALSHDPPSTWPCWTSDGASSAGRSNLALGNRGIAAIGAYMKDAGANNTAAGHRWWILLPSQQTMGTGDITGQNANALEVVDQTTYQPGTGPVRDPGRFISWPAPGYVPEPTVFPRWSLQVDTGWDAPTSLAAATVTVTVNGTSVPVQVETAQDDRIVFIPQLPPTGGIDLPVEVNVTGIDVDGQTSSHHWTTTIISTDSTATAPAQPAPPTGVVGTDQVTLSWTAPANGGSPITGYRIVPSRGGVAQPAFDVPNVTSVTLTGLRGGASYTFTVAARNAKGLGPASTASAAVVVKRSSAESFLTAAYQDYIGRQPTEAELIAGLATVGDASSIQKRSQFTTALAQSDTYLGAVVNKLYVDTLGRTGDPGGVAYWTNQLRTGQVTVAQTAGLFYSSGEYFAGYGGNNLTTWVTDLYNKVLLRSPDPGGLAYYVDLAQRTNRYTVAYPFYQSTESSQTRTQALYQHFLGRPADQAGLDYWSTRIPALGDVALASNLTLSAEYLNRAATRYP